MEKEVKAYEISFLVREEEDVQEVIKHLSGIKADIVNEGPITRIRLAYPIEKENEAYFGFIHFTADPALCIQLTGELEIEPKVVRSLLVTPPFERQATRRRDGRDGRRERRGDTEPVVTQNEFSNAMLEEKLEEITGEKPSVL